MFMRELIEKKLKDEIINFIYSQLKDKIGNYDDDWYQHLFKRHLNFQDGKTKDWVIREGGVCFSNFSSFKCRPFSDAVSEKFDVPQYWVKFFVEQRYSYFELPESLINSIIEKCIIENNGFDESKEEFIQQVSHFYKKTISKLNFTRQDIDICLPMTYEIFFDFMNSIEKVNNSPAVDVVAEDILNHSYNEIDLVKFFEIANENS
jgi:hypothetical protein